MSEIFEKMKMVGEDLYRLGLIDSHGGSISVRDGDKIYINNRDAMLGHLKEEDVVEAGMEAGEADSKASRELNAHRAIYKDTDHKVVVQAHPPSAIVLSLSESKIIPPDAKGVFFIKSVPIVKTRDKIGSSEAARMLPPIYKSGYVIAVVREYASFAVGGSLEEALKYTTCLEQSCKILISLKLLAEKKAPVRQEQQQRRRSSIPPSIGVMDRSRSRNRGRGGSGFNR
ncbi:class II aldolase/adducin family protein [Candidatus Margulisiibacteriota bacterium]